jgi:hypothetical protein
MCDHELPKPDFSELIKLMFALDLLHKAAAEKIQDSNLASILCLKISGYQKSTNIKPHGYS